MRSLRIQADKWRTAKLTGNDAPWGAFSNRFR